jgi:hypothetical protein
MKTYFIYNYTLGTVFFLTQHFKRLPKICRLQAAFLIFFAVSNTEAQVLAEEFAPPKCTNEAVPAIDR